MKQKLLRILALVAVMLVSTSVYAQTLTLGDFDAPTDMYQSDRKGAPIFYTYENSGTQTLYTADELASIKSKEITSISFKCSIAACWETGYSSTLKIYMQEVDSPEFVKNKNQETEWYPITEPIATINYTQDFLAATDYAGDGDGIITFDLSQNPYLYKGKNLIITVVNDNGNPVIDGSNGEVFFYCQPLDNKIRTLSFASDKINFEKNQSIDNVISSGKDENYTNQAPVAKITYQDAPAPAYPEALYVVGNLWGHNWDGNCTDFVLNQDAQTAGLYKGEVIILPVEKGAANGYFKVTAQTGDDWFKYSYAGKNDGDILALDTPTQIWGGAPDGNSNAFQIKANEKYELTVDMTNVENMTITAKNITPAEGPNILTLGDYDNTDLKFDGFNDKITPVVFNYNHSGTQTIYTAEELKEMEGKDITKIAFRMYNEYPYDYTFNAKLYIQEISETKFNFNTKEQSYEWFDYNKNVRAESHQTVTIDTYYSDDELVFDLSDFPYAYDGKTLLLTITNDVDPCLDTAEGFISFYYYEPKNRQSYKYGNDKKDFLTNMNGNKFLNGGNDPEATPVVKFTYEDKIFTEVEDAVAAQKHSVTTAAGAIVVNLSEAAMVQVYDIAGHAVASKNFAEGYNTIEVQKGIYIVKIGNEVHKVCVLN